MNYWTFLTKQLPLCCLTGIALSALPVLAADFGAADWGMTPEQVKSTETRSNLTPFLEENYLIYQIDIPGVDQARIVYQFANGQLSEGRFLFRTNRPLDVTRALEQYQAIKTMLTNQFGPPNTDNVLRKNTDSELLAPEDYANELASDRIILKSSWRSQSATMYHQLAWNNGKPHHQIHYVPSNQGNGLAPANAF